MLSPWESRELSCFQPLPLPLNRGGENRLGRSLSNRVALGCVIDPAESDSSAELSRAAKPLAAEEKLNPVDRVSRNTYSRRVCPATGLVHPHTPLGGSVDMRRRWQRLVVCVSLVAFLVANTHASASIAAHLLALQTADGPTNRSASSLHDASAYATDSSAERPRCHCLKHKSRTAEALNTPRNLHGPCGPSCPDCPKGPSAPKCPCPGGCALCNVAKVPHATPVPCLPCSDTCIETRLPDPSLIYTPPFSGRLIRPPRS